HVVARHATAARTFGWVLASGFFEPVFYLLLVGVGVGELVGDVAHAGATIPYVTFVAPALLASSAMNGAIFESINVFGRLKWEHTYDAMVATPLLPRDVALGELTWCQLRGAAYSAAFVVTMAVLGLIESWWGLLALPAAILVGVAFAATGLAAATYMRSWHDAELVTLVQVPMFLFSATFYPLATYTEPLRWVVRATPLYHGVVLIRQLTLGAVEWSALGHTAYLAAMTALAVSMTFRRFDGLLRS
ncbi:MAG: ABC transporter permease, partial [Acidimicrobiales bacterium]